MTVNTWTDDVVEIGDCYFSHRISNQHGVEPGGSDDAHLVDEHVAHTHTHHVEPCILQLPVTHNANNLILNVSPLRPRLKKSRVGR